MASNTTNSLVGIGEDPLFIIGSLVPIEMVEMATLNSQIAAVAPKAFDYIEELYARNATIAQFMPVPAAAAAAAPGSSKAIVQHTVGSIFRLAKLTGQNHLGTPYPDNLESKIEEAKAILSPEALTELTEMTELDFSNVPYPAGLESIIRTAQATLEQCPEGPGTAPLWQQQIMSAAMSGNVQSIRILLALYTISPEIRSDAFMAALRYYSPDAVKALLKSGPILDSTRGVAVLIAVDRGSIGMAKLLLKSGPISDWHRRMAVRSHCQKEGPSMTEALLASGSISDEDRGFAVVSCCDPQHTMGRENWRLKAMKALLRSGPIAQADREKAVLNAVAMLDAAMVRCLLASGPISDEVRSEAERMAYRARYVQEHVIDLRCLQRAVEEDHRYLEITALLFASNPILDNARRDAPAAVVPQNRYIAIVRPTLMERCLWQLSRPTIICGAAVAAGSLAIAFFRRR